MRRLSHEQHPRPTGAAWAALFVFLGVNLLNYLDRYVLSGILPLLNKPVSEGGLNINDEDAGFIGSAFIIVYTVVAPFIGYLADRTRRLWLLAAGVALWSIVTALCGMAAGFWSLLIMRAMTGIGEASYTTVAPAVLSDHFHKGLRARVMSIFNAAIPVGAAMGFILGGFIGARYGWRHAFFVAAGPGLLLAALIVFLKDPPRGAADPEMSVREPLNPLQSMGLLTRREYLFPCLGYALQTAGLGSTAFFMVTYLVNAKGMELEHANNLFGAITVLTGLTGTLLGGLLSDWWFKRLPQAHLWVAGITSLAAAPVIAMVIGATSPVFIWTLVGIGSFLLVMSIGPVNSQIVNVLSPAERATGMAFSIFLLHALGDVPALPLVGAVARRYNSWNVGFALIPAFVAVGGVIWCWGALDSARQRRGGAEAPAPTGT